MQPVNVLREGIILFNNEITMNKKSCCIFIIICLIPGFLFSQTRLTFGEKKVPVVVYTPFNFYGHLMDAFKCGSEQDYYVVTADKTYLYDNRIGPEYYQGKYCERQLREAPILNISNFRKTILLNDSCFFFAPTPSRKYNNEYLGIKRGEALSFVDIDGAEYASLEELLTKIYDAESLDVFFDAYLSEVRRALYRRGTYNMLYLIRDEEQAKSILKDNYDFIYFHNQDLDLAIDNFVNYVNAAITHEATGEKLKSDLKAFIAGQPKQESFNKAFRAYINDNQEDRIYLTLVDVSPVLRSNLTGQEYERFSKKYAIDQNKTIAAYKYLAKKHHKNIYQDRLPGWDPIYDTIVGYLTKNVLFPMEQVPGI